MRKLFAIMVLGLMAAPAAAQPWYARGEFNGWAGTANQLAFDTGVKYTGTVSGLFASTPEAPQYTEYKITVDDWSVNSPNTNGKVSTDANGEITFHMHDQTSWSDGWFPNNQRRVGFDDPEIFGWEIAGTFNGFPAGEDPNYFLTNTGPGQYHGEFAFNAGFNEFKFRTKGNWNTSVGADFGTGSANNSFRVWATPDNSTTLWKFDLDLPGGRWRAYTDAPSPDYDNNNKVDARDLVLWRESNGNTAAYNAIRANFGFNPPWYIRGSWDGFGTNNPLVQQPDGHYTATVSGLTAGTDYEFKAAHADFSGAVPGSNGKVRADAGGNINFHFYELDATAWNDGWSPDTASRVGYADHQQYDWELVGSFNGWPGTGDPNYYLTDQGNGLHTGSFTFATAGTYNFKMRQQGDWNTSIGNDFGNSAGDSSFTVANNGDTWNFQLDLPRGRWRAFQAASAAAAVPEPASLVLVVFGLLAMGGVRRR